MSLLMCQFEEDPSCVRQLCQDLQDCERWILGIKRVVTAGLC